MEGKPLQPLTHGSVLIVGMMVKDFSDDIRNHPRVTIWDSQNEKWSDKDLPDNTRAVFIGRFTAHALTARLISEARKRQITIFNQNGSGMVTKQIKELLNMAPKPVVEVKTGVKTEELDKRKEGKLKPLIPLIDFAKSNVENAHTLMAKAKELGIETTHASLANTVAVARKKGHRTAVPRSIRGKLDVSVEILDTAIIQLKDVRDFLISTTKENGKLKEKLERFKKLFNEM